MTSMRRHILDPNYTPRADFLTIIFYNLIKIYLMRGQNSRGGLAEYFSSLVRGGWALVVGKIFKKNKCGLHESRVLRPFEKMSSEFDF